MNNCTFLLFPNYVLILTTTAVQCFPSPYEGENRWPHLGRALLQERVCSSKSRSTSTEGGRDSFQVRWKEPCSRREEERITYQHPGRNKSLGPVSPGDNSPQQVGSAGQLSRAGGATVLLVIFSLIIMELLSGSESNARFWQTWSLSIYLSFSSQKSPPKKI